MSKAIKNIVKLLAFPASEPLSGGQCDPNEKQLHANNQADLIINKIRAKRKLCTSYKGLVYKMDRFHR